MPANRFDRTASEDSPRGHDAAAGESASAGPTTGNGSTAGHGPEALRRLQAQLEELGEYGRLYAAAKKDAILSTIRKTVLWTVVGVSGLAVLSAMLITATVLALQGLAQLIGEGLGDRPWAGNLIVGFGLLLVVASALVMAIVGLQRKFRKQTVQKYAKRHETQRSRFGHDVEQQRAAAQRN